ncbi:aspartate/glutamate racemase family protein [Mucilaginibacter polytrichastri]|uniref:Aspartate racemase n=1 Tax=Mucilaginibacter polytrichastri TaxID=1302689 RepID=A0A1Q6A0V8_9SPHI|nr:aspartate/glutamate racemase family protein [Mucilaginibacter polytrichastri]OKS87628.1 hypothetical protein RG47T_3089 [Mucilaginibacter polytrichastri]SFS93023.1 aspartate racemase [Mucilaginibacter polytrichastri]
MKTIGLIGGMSWESSVLYYQLINRKVNQLLGGVHSGKSVMVTVDFEDIAHLQRQGDWDILAEKMIDAAKALQSAGADMVLICANTMHKVSAEVASSIDIPLLHIGDVTAEAIKKQGLKKIGLLGTKYTMEQNFIKDRIQNQGIEVIIPEEADREIIHNVIYSELAKGIVSDDSRKAYLTIMDKLVANGAEGIILGCTEIGMLIKVTDTPIPIFDTTTIHAGKAVELALEK